jgi:hypothetical protein
MSKDEALRLALEALENMANIRNCQREKGYPLSDADKRMQEAITAIKAALEAKDEPVACVIDGDLYFHHEINWEDLVYQGHGIELLYTTPPHRTLVWLTDEEIQTIAFDSADRESAIIKAEAKLKEKNA